MQAVVTPRRGATTVVTMPTPKPGPGEVLIKTEWASISPVDQQTVDGMYTDLGWITQAGPIGLGWEAAGTVEAIGPSATTVRPGQRVVVFDAGVDKPRGALAELVTVAETAVAVLPDHVSTCDAATVPLGVLTAIQGLDLLGAPAGRLLVTGAAGTVGGFALPLARRRGWEILALARETDRVFIEANGARLVTSLDGVIVDAVFDAAFLGDPALAVVADGGRYLGVVPPATPAPVRGITPIAVAVQADVTQLAAAVGFLADGTITARHDSQWPFGQVEQAFAAAATPGTRGRVLMHP